MHDSSHCPICRGQSINGSMTDEEFAAFLDACRAEGDAKQALFRERCGDRFQWCYDLAQGWLEIDSTRFPITLIGSYGHEYHTWLWAWANDEFTDQAREKSRSLQQLHTVTGFAVFADEGMNATEDDVLDLLSLSVHQLGAIGYYRILDGQRDFYLAVHESPAI